MWRGEGLESGLECCPGRMCPLTRVCSLTRRRLESGLEHFPDVLGEIGCVINVLVNSVLVC